MTASTQKFSGVMTGTEFARAARSNRPGGALAFNRKGELRVRSSDGSRWYLIRAFNRTLQCECVAGRHGRICRHIKGDKATGFKGAARFLEGLDPAHLKGAQLAFYWDSRYDPTRLSVRTKPSSGISLEEIY